MNTHTSQSSSNIIGVIAAVWAIVGFSLVLIFAIVRLAIISFDSLNYEWLWFHWVALLLSVTFMASVEGYIGFQTKFSPRFSARCAHLRQHPTLLHAIFAPLFCMGFFHTTRIRMITTFGVSFMVLFLIQLAHMLPQPWRGVLDFGVVIGLVWGLLSLYYFLIKAFSSTPFEHSAELPNSDK